jgi:hypothetical protein
MQADACRRLSAAAGKELRHVPVGSSAVRLAQSCGDVEGRNVAIWNTAAINQGALCPQLARADIGPAFPVDAKLL